MSEAVTCDYCGQNVSESDQDLMIDGMHEACWEEHQAELEEADADA